MVVSAWRVVLLFVLFLPFACSGQERKPLERRPLQLELNGQWIGNAVSYGPYRDGQRPGGPWPSRKEVHEDLRIIVANDWRLLRVYGTREARQVLEIIRAEKLPLKVMIGAWIATESDLDENGAVKNVRAEARAGNETQVKEAIELATKYEKEVFAVSVGNEARVFWSDHITRQDVLIDHVRRVRSKVRVPVTVADDFNYWNKPESHALAAELDFIVLHIHALWAGTRIQDAMAWTRKIYGEIQKQHPEHTIVIGEAGWATRVHDEGEQAKLIKGKVGEKEQKIYYDAFIAWARKKKITAFYFEAFDENWKGGPHPNEVEKHWGLFRADRTPKLALVGSEEKGR